MEKQKHTMWQVECQEFRANDPYCVDFNTKEYYYLGRDYKNIGNPTKDFVNYPDIGKRNRFYFYNDGTNPFHPMLKKGSKVQKELEKRYNDIREQFSHFIKWNKLQIRNDFTNRDNTPV